MLDFADSAAIPHFWLAEPRRLVRLFASSQVHYICRGWQAAHCAYMTMVLYTVAAVNYNRYMDTVTEPANG